MKFKFLIRTTISLCLLMMAFTMFAQNKVVTGVVTGGDDGLTMPRVTVLEKGTNNGTFTDMEGKYSINVSEGSTLVFSFVGYLSKEVIVGNQGILNVVLSVNTTQLDEIVVVGYGTVTKKDATGAVAAIDSKEFNKGVTPSPQDLLVGRIPGVQITTNGGAPGGGASIKIRGGSSLSASNSPLIVVDGVIFSDEGISGLRNPLSIINPNDIETFTVLKDASAAAIYGSRASNGVIIITTKRGKEGQDLQVRYDGNVSVSKLPNRVSVFSGDEFRELVRERTVADPANFPPSILDNLGTENTDWQNEVFETAVSTDHSLSVSGNMGATPFRASYGYTNQNGILKKTNFNRNSLGLSVDPSLLNDNLKIKVNARGTLTDNDFSNQGAIGNAVYFDPTRPVYSGNEVFGGYFYFAQNNGDPNTNSPQNPVALIDQSNNTAKVKSFIGNMEADYQFPFLPDLRAHLNLATTRSNTDGLNVVSNESPTTFDPVNGNGSRNVYTSEQRNELLEFYLKYNTDFDFLESTLEVLGGYSWQRFYRTTASETTNGDESFIIDAYDTYPSENFLVSFFGRVNYNIMDKYLFTFTLRRDGSSRFAEGNKFGLFPSAAFAWRIKDEPFLTYVNAVSDLKLRLGYGTTGQENVAGAYPALARVRFSDATSRYVFGGTPINTVRFEGFDANLKWEETTTYNAGIDFGFIDNRITGNLEYYYRETVDLLNTIPVPAGSNFTNEITTNIGSLENKGVEAGLNAVVVDGAEFSWEAGINATHNTNKITKLTAVNDPSYLGVLTGGIGGGVGNTVQVHSVGYSTNTFFVYQQVYDETGAPIEGLYVDQNEDGIINDFDRVRSENPDAQTYFGFSSRFTYKAFNLSFNARANFNNYVYNNVAAGATYNSIYNPEGFFSNASEAILETGFSNSRYLSDYYIQNASFFRLDNVTLGYSFGRVFSNLMDLSMSFTAQNVFVITNYDGLDPEVSGGIDNNIFPRPRTFLVGISARF